MSKIAAMYDNQTLYNYHRPSASVAKRNQVWWASKGSAALKAANRWSRLDKAVMSYGYAITANLLQMAQGYTIHHGRTFTACNHFFKHSPIRRKAK